MQVKKQQLEPDMEQQTGSKLGKEFAHPGHRFVANINLSVAKGAAPDGGSCCGLHHTFPLH